jgi:hypothetical protein
VDDGMPGVGEICGGSVGVCQQGVTACVGGHIVCSNEVGGTAEVCNGKDDDCDGIVDNDVAPPAAECNPPGLASGAALQGECRPGRFQCLGVDGWACVGGVAPSSEICDGKDNDCDGQIDNGADCGPGLICVTGQCVPRCLGNEQPCAADRYCESGACLLRVCVDNHCPPGQVCDDTGGCYDPCASVTCPAGYTCRGGLCQDCYSRGCPDGQLCHNRQCEPDLCVGVVCAAGQYCAGGTCLLSCAGITCPQGQSCRMGQCVVDPCAGVPCAPGTYCDPAQAVCKSNLCSGISCPGGTKCIEASSKCESDPCVSGMVHCPDQQSCVVLQPGGGAECVPAPTPTPVPAQVKPGSRGLFGCTVGGRGNGVEVETGLLALLGLLLARVRRRGR